MSDYKNCWYSSYASFTDQEDRGHGTPCMCEITEDGSIIIEVKVDGIKEIWKGKRDGSNDTYLLHRKDQHGVGDAELCINSGVNRLYGAYNEIIDGWHGKGHWALSRCQN